jgi:hypothetical protein
LDAVGFRLGVVVFGLGYVGLVGFLHAPPFGFFGAGLVLFYFLGIGLLVAKEPTIDLRFPFGTSGALELPATLPLLP